MGVAILPKDEGDRLFCPSLHAPAAFGNAPLTDLVTYVKTRSINFRHETCVDLPNHARTPSQMLVVHQFIRMPSAEIGRTKTTWTNSSSSSL